MTTELQEIIKRLKESIEKSGLSYVELDKWTGIAKSSIQRYASGTTKKVPIDAIQAIARAVGVSDKYIMGWSDNITEEKKPLPKNLIPLKKIRFVPILGQIACGEPILAEQNYEGSVMVPENVNATFALRCKGDSMIDANIQDGDVVFVQETPKVENGEIAAVVIGDEATLKKVYYQNDTITLMPANSSFEPLVYKREEINDIRICGKAVAVLRYIK